jgi:small GTP-binding protein
MNIPVNYEQLLKVLILGDTNVGKTNFLLRFTENNFVENHITTIGFDYKSSVITIPPESSENNSPETPGRTVKLQIWDTAGQERFMSVTKNLLLRVQGIIIMYDITTKSTFDNVKRWITSIRENTNEKMPIVMVGNKLDLEANRQVSFEKAQSLAVEYGIQDHFFEASAKNNINVKEVFIDLTREVLKTVCKLDGNTNLKIKKEQDNEKKKSRCC